MSFDKHEHTEKHVCMRGDRLWHPTVPMTSRTHVGISFVHGSRHEGRYSNTTNADYMNLAVAAREKGQNDSAALNDPPSLSDSGIVSRGGLVTRVVRRRSINMAVG